MLQKITIQNFRSLKDVSLDLQDVNVLIGANNSGKTNFLKALEFLGKIIKNEFKPDFLINNLRNISYKHLANNIFFRFDGEVKFNYYLGVDHKKELHTGVTLKDNVDLNKSNSRVEVVNFISPKKENKFDSDTLEKIMNNISIFETIILYNIDSSKLTKPAHLTSDNYVKADASNLVAFLDNMNGAYRKIFNQIQKDLTQCIEEFLEINLHTVDLSDNERSEYGKDKDKTFKKLGLTDKFGNTYWAEELSEGTLYFLALLAIIHQPNPPKLLLLEEPERGIHPRRIKEVMDFIFRLSSEKQIQIILTTHSPIVLDCFRDYPEKVFVFDKDEEGATIVKNLEKDILIPLEEKEIANGLEPSDYTRSMGTNWEAGFFGGVPKNIKIPVE